MRGVELSKIRGLVVALVLMVIAVDMAMAQSYPMCMDPSPGCVSLPCNNSCYTECPDGSPAGGWCVQWPEGYLPCGPGPFPTCTNISETFCHQTTYAQNIASPMSDPICYLQVCTVHFNINSCGED